MNGFCNGIKEHSEWKLWFKNSIDAGLELNINEVEDFRSCELGKWIDSVVNYYGETQVFMEMCHTHKLFHITAGEVARHIKDGDLEKSKMLMDPLGEYSYYSNKLISELILCNSILDRISTCP